MSAARTPTRPVDSALTVHTPGGRPARPPAAFPVPASCSRRPAGPAAGSVTYDDDRRQPAKEYWPIRRASNNLCLLLLVNILPFLANYIYLFIYLYIGVVFLFQSAPHAVTIPFKVAEAAAADYSGYERMARPQAPATRLCERGHPFTDRLLLWLPDVELV